MNDKGFTSKDVNELRDVLDTVSERVPKLIKGLIGTLYSKEAGASMGQSVGAYYQELVASGIPQDAALEMAKSYAISIKDIAGKGMNFQAGSGKKHTEEPRWDGDGAQEESSGNYDPHHDDGKQ
ncbi:MAG: hypothetical protein PHP02_02930 [Eubacteriales bacterium]|nr:hypothetical protein [Eubacteriales bacterium]